MKNASYKGVRPALIVSVLEGSGTPEDPFHSVDYVIVNKDFAGFTRPYTLGRVEPLDPDFFGIDEDY